MPGIRSYPAPHSSALPAREPEAEGARAERAPESARPAAASATTPDRPVYGTRQFLSKFIDGEKPAAPRESVVGGDNAMRPPGPVARAARLNQPAGAGLRPTLRVRPGPAAGANASASRADTLVQVTLPRYAGAQAPRRIAGTEYCRQVAELLIDAGGRFDRTHLPRLLDELLEDGRKPAAQQILGVYHREHMTNILLELQSDDELVEKVNLVCEHEPLLHTAADVVRSTLNLPADHPLNKGDARKAVVMALIGNLRQGRVGSCFAISSAIAVYRECPRALVDALTWLLEKRCLRPRGAQVPVPLNSRCNPEAVEALLVVKADGSCLGTDSTSAEAHWLYQHPGMRRALHAMGIPAYHHAYYVRTALEKFSKVAGIDPDTAFMTSPADLIRCLARDAQDALRQEKRVRAGLSAYAGTEDVGLLRAWEYTLAGYGHSLKSGEMINWISKATLFGGSIPGHPHLRSPWVETGEIHADELAADPYFQNSPVHTIADRLFSDVEATLKRRFYVDFDSGLKSKQVATDRRSNYGGWVLCDRTRPGTTLDERTIGTATLFQEAVETAVKSAMKKTRRQLQNMGGDPKCNGTVLKLLGLRLLECINQDDYRDQAILRFNQQMGNGVMLDDAFSPWRFDRGGYGELILRNYGVKTTVEKNVSDAGNLILALGEAQQQMDTLLREKAAAMSGRGFHAGIAGGGHEFSVLPMETADIWQAGMSPADWMWENLQAPAVQYASGPRDEPPLPDLIMTLAAELGIPEQRTRELVQDMVGACVAGRDGRPEYSLRRVHNLLTDEFETDPDSDEKVALVTRKVMHHVPPPEDMTKFLMDTNWQDRDGNPIYVAFTYDPFESRVEAVCRNKDDTVRFPFDSKWMNQTYKFHGPLKLS